MEKLILLQIDIMYFETKYNEELVPLRKYRYWESLRKAKELFEEENK